MRWSTARWRPPRWCSGPQGTCSTTGRSETLPHPSSPRRWLITGVSSGLGRALAEAALARGDRVCGTLRKADQALAVSALAPGRSHGLQLDLTDRPAVRRVVDLAADRMGGLDFVVNNAGYCLAGPLEAVSAEEASLQIDTNLLGPLAVIQGALPHLRRANGGRILNIGSLASVMGFAGMGLYCASKFALAGLSEALAAEVAEFGIKVTVVEPSGFRTNFAGASVRFAQASIPEYAGFERLQRERLARSDGAQMNDPKRGAQALLALADHPDPPLHFALGADAAERIRGVLEQRLAEYRRGDPDGSATGFREGTGPAA